MSATDTTPTTDATAPAVARRPRFALVVEPRPHAALGTRVATIAACLFVALAGGALLLAVSGYAPLDVYGDIVETSFGSRQAFSQTLVVTTPLILTSLAAAVAYRVRLYTVGADGQLVIGAICASGVALALGDDLGGLATIALSLAAGVAGGALWASIAAVPRAYLGTNEIISTLMLNFVALNLMTYLVLGSRSFWRDPVSAQPIGRQVPETALLPPFFDQADVGILLVVAVALGVWLLMQRTRWGYAVRVAGDSRRAAVYAGIDVRRTIVAVLCLSGALAGLAGAIQVTNVTQALDPDALNPGLG
ncbi:MAG TPA: ABC transporter permease, partial [Conexibacter sp.]|nr:ABC transporter permease [Conexibacter sp.]